MNYALIIFKWSVKNEITLSNLKYFKILYNLFYFSAEYVDINCHLDNACVAEYINKALAKVSRLAEVLFCFILTF